MLIDGGEEVTFDTAVLIITGWVFCVGLITKVTSKRVHHAGGADDRVRLVVGHARGAVAEVTVTRATVCFRHYKKIFFQILS